MVRPLTKSFQVVPPHRPAPSLLTLNPGLLFCSLILQPWDLHPPPSSLQVHCPSLTPDLAPALVPPPGPPPPVTVALSPALLVSTSRPGPTFFLWSLVVRAHLASQVPRRDTPLPAPLPSPSPCPISSPALFPPHSSLPALSPPAHAAPMSPTTLLAPSLSVPPRRRVVAFLPLQHLADLLVRFRLGHRLPPAVFHHNCRPLILSWTPSLLSFSSSPVSFHPPVSRSPSCLSPPASRPSSSRPSL